MRNSVSYSIGLLGIKTVFFWEILILACQHSYQTLQSKNYRMQHQPAACTQWLLNRQGLLQQVQPSVQTSLLISLDDISDHLPIYLAISVSKQEPVNVDIHPFTEQNNKNKEKFIDELGSLDRSDVLLHCENGDASTAYCSFNITYLRIYDALLPCHSQKKSCHFRKALMTPGLLKSCRKKNIFYSSHVTEANSSSNHSILF